VQVMVTPDGSSAVRVPGSSNVIEVLRSLGNYQTFVLALQVGTPCMHIATCTHALIAEGTMAYMHANDVSACVCLVYQCHHGIDS
jgi:hypothetical protein